MPQTAVPNSVATTPAGEEPLVRLAHGSPTSPRVHPTLLHSGMSTSRFFAMHALGAFFPVAAGLLLYGWRALLVLGTVVGATAIGVVLWRRAAAPGQRPHLPHALWLGLLLGLMLPAHLATAWPRPHGGGWPLWPILPGAGLLLGAFIWLLGGVGSGRIHPLLITYLLVAILFPQDMVPTQVLARSRAFLGDSTDAVQHDEAALSKDPWIRGNNTVAGHDALYREPLGQRLVSFTSGLDRPLRAWLSLEALLRDRVPPLEDLIAGGQPGPIGVSSGVAVIIGGLFLLYRGVADFRIPLLVVLAAYVALLVLPVPVVITESGPVWRWLAMREHGVGWTIAVTFANYEIMAGPLLFTAFFLAAAPAIRPMARRARVIYAVLIGLLSATLQLYVSLPLGPYIALAIIGLLTPRLDRWFRPRSLI